MTPIPQAGVTTGHSIAAEYTKVRSIRSWALTLLAAAFATVAVGAITANDVITYWDQASSAQRATFDPIWVSLSGFALTQLVFGVLGVLAISSEYATGTIRTTFTAMPQRWTVLAGKTTVVATSAFLAGELIAVASFFIGQATLSARDLDVSLGQPGVLRGLLGAGFFLTVMALVGLGLGAMIRNTAGAISVLVGLILLLPPVAQALPTPWDLRIGRCLLPEPGKQMILLDHTPGQLSAGPAFLVCAAYASTILLVAGLLLTRRDA
jgi:ABC-2 type transport system permease protein